MSTPNTVDVTEAIEQAPFGSLQLLILALCAWIALLDGFDTQVEPRPGRNAEVADVEKWAICDGLIAQLAIDRAGAAGLQVV